MKKNRPKENHGIIYGKNPVYEMVKAGKRPVKEVLVAGDMNKFKESVLFGMLKTRGVSVSPAENVELDRLCQNGVHQGIVARVGVKKEVFLDDLLKDAKEKELVLMLDSIQDPQNFGALCRSALAFGVRYVILPKDRSVHITAAVVKASAGAVEHLNIIFVTNLAQAMERLKKENYWFYGASLQEWSQSLHVVDPAQKSVVVLGAEGTGLRRLVLESCDVLIKIPMAAGFDSLNVAQAGSVILYEFNKKMFASS